jgi:cob(I)alamin adenosyltransferase
MVSKIVNDISTLVNELKTSINQDILDIKEAKHEELLKRNDEKHHMIDEIMNLKMQLNKELMAKIQEGEDVNIYRESVDFLESQLRELYELNKKLASIILPVQQMYKDLVSDIASANGGQIFDIKA